MDYQRRTVVQGLLLYTTHFIARLLTQSLAAKFYLATNSGSRESGRNYFDFEDLEDLEDLQAAKRIESPEAKPIHHR